MQQHASVCEELKRLGYKKDAQIRMYGQEFELISDPIAVDNHGFVADAIELKSGRYRRLSIPLPVIHIARRNLPDSQQ